MLRVNAIERLHCSPFHEQEGADPFMNRVTDTSHQPNLVLILLPPSYDSANGIVCCHRVASYGLCRPRHTLEWQKVHELTEPDDVDIDQSASSSHLNDVESVAGVSIYAK